MSFNLMDAVKGQINDQLVYQPCLLVSATRLRNPKALTLCLILSAIKTTASWTTWAP